MRLAVVVGACILAACASERLAPKAPTGVDLSGHWVLDEADSDDAQRLMQSQLTAATNATAQATAARRQGRSPAPGAMGPVMPPVMVLDEGLRWPGKDVSIRQAGGLITFSSLGNARDCRLAPSRRRHIRATAGGAMRRRRAAAGIKARWSWYRGNRRRPPPYEQRFSVSADGEQLVELVVFKGGRSDGFTASRVWHRAPATTSAAPQKPPQ